MIDSFLGFMAPGPVEVLFIFIFLGIPVIIVVLLLRIFLRNKKENVRLRLEVGKLADELEKMRKQENERPEAVKSKSG